MFFCWGVLIRQQEKQLKRYSTLLESYGVFVSAWMTLCGLQALVVACDMVLFLFGDHKNSIPFRCHIFFICSRLLSCLAVVKVLVRWAGNHSLTSVCCHQECDWWITGDLLEKSVCLQSRIILISTNTTQGLSCSFTVTALRTPVRWLWCASLCLSPTL